MKCAKNLVVIYQLVVVFRSVVSGFFANCTALRFANKKMLTDSD